MDIMILVGRFLIQAWIIVEFSQHATTKMLKDSKHLFY